MANVQRARSGTMCDIAQRIRSAYVSVITYEKPQTDDQDMHSLWGGHSAVTRSKLLEILERADGGCEDFSMADRILFTACEFWAAVEAGTLKAFLGTTALEQLRCSAFAYKAIGAAEVARELEVALRVLSLADTSHGRTECIESLQDRLRSSAAPTGDLIDKFSQLVH